MISPRWVNVGAGNEQRRKLGGHQDSSFRRASDLAFRCLSAILFGMRSISGKRVEG